MNNTSVDRRSFLRTSALGTTAALLGGSGALLAGSEILPSLGEAATAMNAGDREILFVASIAEALAVTTYTNIINLAPFFKRIPDDDQDYLIGARQEEMSHYNLEVSLTGQTSPYTSFYYPPGMFADPQTTLDILVTLEDAFIAAYLVGVRNMVSGPLRVIAAQIMGIESDHRTLARVVCGDVSAQDNGPLTQTTGLQGVAESITPPQNNTYERTQGWGSIDRAVEALGPFLSASAANAAGFDSTKPYVFHPFQQTDPSPLGVLVPKN